MKTITVTPGTANIVTVTDSTEPTSVSSPAGSLLDAVGLPVAQPIPIGYAVANIGGQAYRFDVANPNHAYAFAGIAVTSAVLGQFVFVQPEGITAIPGFNLTPGAIYHVGPNGALTTIPNLSTFLQTIGKAIDANTLLLRADDPIFL